MNICEVMNMKDILESITFCITIIAAVGTIIMHANTIFFQRKLMLPGKRILCELAQGIVLISATTWLITEWILLDEPHKVGLSIIMISIGLGVFIWVRIDSHCNNKDIFIIINEDERYRIEYAIDGQLLMCEKTGNDNDTSQERLILSRQILNNAMVLKDEEGNYIVKVCEEKVNTYNVTVEKK